MQNKGVILDSYKQIKEVFEQNNVQKPFVCCGKSFQNTEIFEYLKQFNIVVWDNIRPNPRFEDMVAATELFKKEKCDFMIGAGGGSPLDSAKMIRMMSTNNIDTCLKEPMQNNDIKALFIPTTAGTGSEATKTSVFYLNENQKFSVHSLDFIPNYIIFDETLLETLPDYQRKCTCLDALCHAVESYWSTKANDESKAYAKEAIELFCKHYQGYVNNEREHNRGMLMASYYGGKAINLTGTTSAHAMCYNITMNCNTSHGHSCIAGLIEIWKYMLEHNENVNDKRGREYVLSTFDDIAHFMGVNTPEDAVRKLQNIVNEFNLQKPKAKIEQIDDFVSKVNVKKLTKNPTVLSSEDIKNIYLNIFDFEN